MANVLAFMAEEIGQAGTLIYAGIGIAVKLNYEVMSYVLTTTARIVQLLLLLTHKASDVITIITNDTLLFLGDIGNGVYAISLTLVSLCYGLSVAISAIIASCYAAVEHIIFLIAVMRCYSANAVVYFITQFGNLMLFIRSIFILFGSSVLFAVTFIPNLLCLLSKSIIESIQMAKLNMNDGLHSFKIKFLSGISQSSAIVLNYFKEIPLSSLLGFGLSIFFLLSLKFILRYLRVHHILVLNNFTMLTLLSNIYDHIRDFILTLWQIVGNISTHYRRNSVEEEIIDEDVGNENLIYQPNLEQTNGPSGSSLQRNGHGNRGASDISQDQNNIDSILFDRSNLTRRPLSRRQRVLGLADNVTENEVLLCNDIKTDKTIHMENNSQKPSPNSEWAKQLYRELEAERENQLCVICQDKPKRVILLPCRHLCLCESCRSAVIIRDRNCPICRRPITDTLRVYV